MNYFSVKNLPKHQKFFCLATQLTTAQNLVMNSSSLQVWDTIKGSILPFQCLPDTSFVKVNICLALSLSKFCLLQTLKLSGILQEIQRLLCYKLRIVDILNSILPLGEIISERLFQVPTFGWICFKMVTQSCD